MKKLSRQEKLALYPVSIFFGLYPLFNAIFYSIRQDFGGVDVRFLVMLFYSPVLLAAGLVCAGIVNAAYIPWIRQTKSSRRSIFFIVFAAVMSCFYFFVLAKFASANCSEAGLAEGCNFGKISFVFFATFFWLSLMAAAIFKSVDAEKRDDAIDV